ncbi:MAG: OmpH family outer membrane protein [Prevotellaceae bacterium]|jgi:outer membrane protein|nr:OmpH family outer membrane protein [Prevotellaceae bacterium]
MKKIIKITKVNNLLTVLIIAIAFVACNNNGSVENKNAGTPKTDSSEHKSVSTLTDIAYIRVDSIIQNYDMYHDLKRGFEQKAKKMQTEFEGQVKALEKDMADFNEKYEKMLVTQSQAQEQAQRLKTRENDLNNKASQMRSELMEEESVMFRNINDVILKYVEKYNETKKYSLILNHAAIIIASPSIDITSEILQGLNQEYIAGKANK